MSHWRKSATFLLSLATTVTSLIPAAQATDEVFGPVNLIKTMPTPFGTARQNAAESAEELRPMTLRSPLQRSLSKRLVPPRLYLPGRMVIGSTAEFIVKGPPNSWAALAMADRNSGSKPIYGHEVRLGPDRKLVSMAQIPESGVASLVIDTPIQGDLIGQPLYFEAAIWSKPDFSDVELADPVVSESTGSPSGNHNNGVIVAAEPDKKRGLRIVPDGMVPLQQRQGAQGINSGRP